MLRTITGAWLLILLSAGMAGAQARHVASRSFVPSTLAITYNAERAKKISPGTCGCFWFQGGAADADWHMWNRLGIAAELSGSRASNVAPGVDVKKIDFLLGPRYVWQPAAQKHKRHTSVFGEFLIGSVHAFNTVIPTSTGVASSATAFALQTGAGTNLWLSPHFGFRVIELDYTYSRLPNTGDSTQNGLRIASGLIWNLR